MPSSTIQYLTQLEIDTVKKCSFRSHRTTDAWIIRYTLDKLMESYTPRLKVYEREVRR
ncbi:hypothetical protein JCM19029_04860 [Salinicoccus sesuvii]